jgi:hypothetical protein
MNKFLFWFCVGGIQVVLSLLVSYLVKENWVTVVCVTQIICHVVNMTLGKMDKS